MTWLENSMRTAQADETTEGRSQRTVPRRRGADVYDALLWRLDARLESIEPVDTDAATLVGVTSCDRRAGVSTVAANLAIRAADHCMGPVLLIDASTERPVIGPKFGLKKAIGLADVLAQRCDVSDAAHASGVQGLDVMPIGAPGLIEQVGLAPESIDALFNGVRESYELVFVDLPAAGQMCQMLLLARRLDATILTVRSEATRRSDVERTAAQLRGDGVPIAGSVLVRQKQYVPRWLARRL